MIFGQDTIHPIRDSDVKDIFPLQLLLNTFLKQHLVFVFKTNPWVYFVKSHECFFIHFISFPGLLHAKGNMIKAAQEEFWLTIRHNGYFLWEIQKGEIAKICVDPLGWCGGQVITLKLLSNDNSYLKKIPPPYD